MRLASTASIALALFVLPACSTIVRPSAAPAIPSREFSTTVLLNRKPLELHVASPGTSITPRFVVLYASGDGGWFGAAVDMFRQLAGAGYAAVGFSSRAFLKIERPRGTVVTAVQLAAEYEQILMKARSALALDRATPAVLTGWSRGAAFAVLVGSEHVAQANLLGVVAIGLGEGEDLDINGPEDETDDGQAAPVPRRWPFDTYARIARLDPLPCAVIQSTHDEYLPAASARQRFGPDTLIRRFYAVDARNHRFSGGKAAFTDAWLDAIRWIVSQHGRQGGNTVQ
jgi:hypothetical protein